MADKPILFSGDMIRALLDGRKTQTRRVITKAAAHDALATFGADFLTLPGNRDLLPVNAVPGDRLWVRETWNAFDFSQDGDEAWPCKKIPTLEEIAEINELGHRVSPPQAVYRESDRARKWFSDQKWRPGIHMPRWASRLTLTVTQVRVERLQDISQTDATAEGCLGYVSRDGEDGESPEEEFHGLWESLNAERAPWSTNPWVAAYTFTVARNNIDAAPAAA